MRNSNTTSGKTSTILYSISSESDLKDCEVFDEMAEVFDEMAEVFELAKQPDAKMMTWENVATGICYHIIYTGRIPTDEEITAHLGYDEE